MQRKETFILTILSLLFVALFVYGTLGNNISEPKKTTTTTLDSSFKNKTLTVGEKRNKSSSSNNNKKKQDDDIIRIVCIGDSLTAGVTSVGNKDWKPYGPYLQAQMEQDLLLSSSNNSSSKNISILHYGYPGWTSADLMHGRNKNSDNMESILSSATTSSTESNLSLDLVIIMAGTNDMLRGRYNSYNVSQQVIELHQFGYEHYSVPRSILLEIPGAKAYERDSDLKKEVDLLSQHMRTFAETESRATFVPFPFDYKDDDDKWSEDKLHCTEKGYRALAEYLAPIVEQILLLH